MRTLVFVAAGALLGALGFWLAGSLAAQYLRIGWEAADPVLGAVYVGLAGIPVGAALGYLLARTTPGS